MSYEGGKALLTALEKNTTISNINIYGNNIKSLQRQIEEKTSSNNKTGKRLLEAAKSGNINMIRTLVEAEGASVNYRDSAGNTALHYAASEKHLNVIYYLLEQPGQVLIRNEEGKMPDCKSGCINFDWGNGLLMFSGKFEEVKNKPQQKTFGGDVSFRF